MSENFKQIQQQLRLALNEPTVPERLVAHTCRLCEAVVWGQKAEKQLEQNGANLSKQDIVRLTAIGVLGQLALGKCLPDMPSLSVMAQQLADQPWFQNRCNGTARDALHGLHSGVFLRPDTKITKPRPARKAGTGACENNGPVR